MTDKPKERWDLTDTSHPLYDPIKDPTHPFYEADQKERPVSAKGSAYKVGPGFPPNEHKWKKGCSSPYPKGRPKKKPSLKPDVKKIFEDALNEKVPVAKAEKNVMLSKLTLGFKQLATQFAKGDRHARRDVFTYAAILGVDLHGKEVIAEALGVTQQAIVDAFLQRQHQPSVRPEPDIRVKAPPDLIDDDVTPPKSDQSDKPAVVPAKPRPLPERPKPELDEHGRPKPRDRAFIQKEREWNMALQKKIQDGS
jgi:hypothetical protein